jgi:hypothetical protein
VFRYIGKFKACEGRYFEEKAEGMGYVFLGFL